LYQETKLDRVLLADISSIVKLIPTAEVNDKWVRVGFIYNQ